MLRLLPARYSRDMRGLLDSQTVEEVVLRMLIEDAGEKEVLSVRYTLP